MSALRLRASLLSILALGALRPLAVGRTISADASKIEGATNRMPEFCVGAGRASEGLRADWQRQLRRVRAECGFRYIRFHGLAKGNYRLRATKVGYRANDVQSAWRELDSPAQLTRTHVQTLRDASSGTPEMDETICVEADGCFLRHFAMRENDVWFVALRPL